LLQGFVHDWRDFCWPIQWTAFSVWVNSRELNASLLFGAWTSLASVGGALQWTFLAHNISTER
jgi:hypothetical protein